MQPTTEQSPLPTTFEAAIAFTQDLLTQQAQHAISDAEFGTTVTQLVATHNGARGFFVAYLTDTDHPNVDALMPVVVTALQPNGAIAAELLVKNLAMSTAMAITHTRNGHPELAQQSIQVQRRTAHLMRELGFAYCQPEAEALWHSLTRAEGTYATFLQKWGYDAEQQQAIAQQLQTVLPEVSHTAP